MLSVTVFIVSLPLHAFVFVGNGQQKPEAAQTVSQLAFGNFQPCFTPDFGLKTGFCTTRRWQFINYDTACTASDFCLGAGTTERSDTPPANAGRVPQ